MATPIGLVNPTISDIADQGVIEKRYDGVSTQEVHSYELDTAIALEKYEALIDDIKDEDNNYTKVDLVTPRDGIGRVQLHSQSFNNKKLCKIYRHTLADLPLHTHPEFRPGGGGDYELHPDEVWEGYHIAKTNSTSFEGATYSTALLEFIAKLRNGEWGYAEFCMVFRIEYYYNNYVYLASNIGKQQSYVPLIVSDAVNNPPLGGYWFSPGPRATTFPGTRWVYLVWDWWWKEFSWENRYPDLTEDLSFDQLYAAAPAEA